MKLTVNNLELKSNLSTVCRAIPAKPAHPILGNVYLKADIGTQKIILIGFDLSLGIRSSFQGEVIHEGEITVPAKLFYEIISRLPEGDITLELEETTLNIESNSGKYKVQGVEADDYPALPEINSDESIEIPALTLLEGLKGTLFSTASDETKQVLTGVHLKADFASLEFAATDGHRLAVLSTEIVFNGELEMTIPAKALREVERVVSKVESDYPVELKFDNSQVLFKLDSQRITSRRLDGQYPPYPQLIPSQFNTHINIDRQLFVKSLERVGVLATQKNGIVQCSIDSTNQEISISAEATEVGNAVETLPAQITADESLEFAFNVKYLLEGLKTFNTTEVLVQLNQPNNPVVLSPVGGLKMTYLVMPVQKRS